VNVIENERITEKIRLKLPERVEGVLKCRNPRCITSTEAYMPHIFHLVNEKTACTAANTATRPAARRISGENPDPNVRVVDEATDRIASVLIEDGRIAAVLPPGAPLPASSAALRTLDPGTGTVLMPAFVELHAHFRDPGYPNKETLESGSLAAAAGGYGTVVCMANTKPAMDDPAAAAALKARSDALGLVDLYPAMSLTRGCRSDTSAWTPWRPPRMAAPPGAVRILSEDGKDVADDAVFLSAAEGGANGFRSPALRLRRTEGRSPSRRPAAGVSRIEEDTHRQGDRPERSWLPPPHRHCSTVKAIGLSGTPSPASP
jgi:hypothetical protein